MRPLYTHLARRQFNLRKIIGNLIPDIYQILVRRLNHTMCVIENTYNRFNLGPSYPSRSSGTSLNGVDNLQKIGWKGQHIVRSTEYTDTYCESQIPKWITYFDGTRKWRTSKVVNRMMCGSDLGATYTRA